MTIQIQQGLFDHMVLQRNASGKSQSTSAGTCDSTGKVQIRVTKNGKPLPGFNWKSAGTASRKKFQAKLDGIPAGGPYTIDLRIGDETVKVEDVLVGDVWVLAGQSNMQGCARREHAAKPDPRVRAFYMDDRWDVARDPIHNLWDSVDAVHSKGKAPDKTHGVGPGVAFAQDMLKRTGVPQGLIPCAHGGTSMAQWSPSKSADPQQSLYASMLRRVRNCAQPVAGLLWYQGESDTNRSDPRGYTADMKALVARTRKDFGRPKLPWAMVQLGRHIGVGVRAWNEIRDQQRLLPEQIDQLVLVPAIDLELDDGIHIGGDDVNRLGRRLAQAMVSLNAVKTLKPARREPRPIALKEIRLEPAAHNTVHIVAEFENVVGSLRAGGRPIGFSIVNPPAHNFPVRTDLKGNRAILRVPGPMHQVAEHFLHFGHGDDPHCNITDEADRCVPAFGPVQLGKPRAMTDWINQPLVSAPQPSAEKLHKLKYPADLAKLGFKKQSFPGYFCDLHLQIKPQDAVYYFRADLDCDEAMPLLLHIAYDGPVKVWWDGRQVFHDPKGTNPAHEHTAEIPIKTTPGRHEALLALGTNHGNAWGIAWRVERTGVPAHKVRHRDFVIPLIVSP